MKKLFITTAAVALSAMAFAAPASACFFGCGGNSANEPTFSASGAGSLSGSASSFAGTAGVSVGNGSTLAEASQFSGNTGTVTFAHDRTDPSAASFTGTSTNESFSSGYAKSNMAGSAFGGALHGGDAFGNSSHFGQLSTDW